jgi:hypothetical protein
MSINISFDADEGQWVTICCLSCRKDIEYQDKIMDVARVSIATPVRMYIACLECIDCGEELIEYDAFSHEVIEHARQL